MDEVGSEKTRRVLRNRWNSQETETSETLVAHTLTENGGIASGNTQLDVTCDCGCVGSPGGICAVCHERGKSGIICHACFTRCVCGKPLGPCHAVIVRDAEDRPITLCPTCAGERRRVKIARFFLDPIVRFKD